MAPSDFGNWYKALTSSDALTFAQRGSGAPTQRPTPEPKLQFWLRIMIRVASFQIVWAAVFLAMSLTIRRSLIGSLLNLPYAVCALLGIYGALRLSYVYVALSILSSLAVDLMFFSFATYAYVDSGEVVILLMYYPWLGVDFFLLLACAPLVHRLYRCEHPRGGAAVASSPSVQAAAAAAAAPPTAEGDQAAADAAMARALQVAEDGAADGLRADLRCPISLEVMRDPVIAADGHSYERASIEQWLRTRRTSPLTGQPLPNQTLIPNHRLRAMIEDVQAAGV